MKKVHEEHKRDVAKMIDETEKAHEIVRVNASEIEERKKGLNRKISDMSAVSVKLKSMSEILEKLQESGTEIREDNVLEFVKPANLFQEKWIHSESKKAAIEEALMQVRKAYEDKVIPLKEFLDVTRKLSSSQFLCIYKKQHMEQLQRKHG